MKNKIDVRGVDGGGGVDPLGEGSKGQGPGTIQELTRALVNATQVFTVSVLIFVGLVIHGTMVRLARIL